MSQKFSTFVNMINNKSNIEMQLAGSMPAIASWMLISLTIVCV